MKERGSGGTWRWKEQGCGRRGVAVGQRWGMWKERARGGQGGVAVGRGGVRQGVAVGRGGGRSGAAVRRGAGRRG